MGQYKDLLYICSSMRKWLIIGLLLWASFPLWAQTDTLRLGFSVSGKVQDAETGLPMESVHVSLPGRQIATVTNADGFFQLKSDQEIATLDFSCLGYRTQHLQAREGMKVRLVRESLTLQEALIVGGDPESIVLAAVENLKQSYCTEPELLECFYRETVQKRKRFTYVAEAVARLYKAPYDGTVNGDGAALEKSRVLVSQRLSDTLSVKTQGGPSLAIYLDMAKNKDLLFNPHDLSLYRFQMDYPVYIDNRLQFVIHLIPNAMADYALYNCTLYIDRESLAFTQIEASLDMSDKRKATNMMLVKKPLTLRFFPEEATVVMHYRLQDGKARLQYFRSTTRFSCDWRKRLFRTHYTTINELVVTDVRPEAVPIGRKESFYYDDILSEKAGLFLDPDFWQDYNIIEPSESLEHAISRLRKGR